MIAILVDIAVKNPRVYPIAASILSCLLKWISEEEREDVFIRIKGKLDKVANNGHLQLWLQRISYFLEFGLTYCEPLCRVLEEEEVDLCNNEWISSTNLKQAISSKKILSKASRKKLEFLIPRDEISLFEGY